MRDDIKAIHEATNYVKNVKTTKSDPAKAFERTKLKLTLVYL